jgi:histidine phosphotransferase ChpT
VDDPKLLEVLEVFAARICHDLVGAVGAVSNGVELLSEGGEAADPEVLALISSSARTASRRLQYFRTAFGTGSALSATRPLDGARSLAASFLEEGKVALDWAEPPAAAEAAAGRRAAKAVLNLVIVAADCLPRGGRVAIEAAPVEAGLSIRVRASGAQARLADDHRAALAASVGAPTPRGVPSWIVRALVDSAKGNVDVTEGQDMVVLGLRVPRQY